MRRICFIGNSHLAAVKLGVDALAEQHLLNGYTCHFFASPGINIMSLAIKDGCMVPIKKRVKNNFEWTSGGMTQIDLASYDDMYWVSKKSPFDIYQLFACGNDISPLSTACVRAVLRGLLQDDISLPLWHAIVQESSSIRLHFVGAPFVSEDAPRVAEIVSRVGTDKNLSLRIEEMRDRIDQILLEMQAPFSSMVRPPEHLLTCLGLFRKKEFNRNSIRLSDGYDTEHRAADYMHANARYGAEMVTYLLGLSGAGAGTGTGTGTGAGAQAGGQDGSGRAL